MKPLLVFFVVLFVGCLTDPEVKKVELDGVYTVIAMSDSGTVEYRGWIKIAMQADSSIIGTWQAKQFQIWQGRERLFKALGLQKKSR